ncbi:innexin inx2-like [Stegodyphus dumicola]|uniref:innexin inx2-like n=1 Tax=Stegodyphus dumicola TaxID=202533 RepID=UPI0015AF243C|nr:innexin inx2-like [Stegodyphus dumicola]
MDKLFGSLKNFLKINAVVIDNNVFRLHYRFTVLVLLAFSILVTSRQYIGDPIDCISRDDIPSKLLDSFCWIHSTFSVESAWHKKVGVEVPYPGVDKYTPEEKRVYHAYYQWVCFVLFLQAMLFYIPRYLWKMWEGGRVRALILGLNSPIMSYEKKEENRKILVEYLTENMGNHTLYAAEYFICEVLNFVNVVGQMYLMDKFLGGEFSSYGHKVLQFTEWDYSVRYDPMIHVFPRLTKCTFHRYGSSGDVQRHDAMCILPINIINEKIYVFLWFWFVILSVFSALILAFHVVIFAWPQSRFLVLRSRARLTRPDYLDIVLRKCSHSDWFVLDLLCKNIDSLNYRDLIADLARKLERKAVDMA